MGAETIVAIIAASVPGLLALGAGWWRLGRMERDIEQRATSERVDALEKHIEGVDAGVEKKLDRMDEDLKAIRHTTDRIALRVLEDTSPGGRTAR